MRPAPRHLIVLDLETKHMIEEVEKTQAHIWFSDRKQASRDLWGRLRSSNWFGVESTIDIQRIIQMRGRPQFAPYLAKLSNPGPIRTIQDLYRAVVNEDIDVADLAYNPQLHEIYIEENSSRKTWRLLEVNRRLGMSIAVTWDAQNGFRHWPERDVDTLIEELCKFRVVVGANLFNFDYRVLERYVPEVRNLLGFRTIDILGHARWALFLIWLTKKLRNERVSKERVAHILRRHRVFPGGELDDPYRFRDSWYKRARLRDDVWNVAAADTSALYKNQRGVSLGNLARGTLGQKKLGKAANALNLYRTGQLKELAEYCQQDVALTRDIFLHGLEHGYVRFGEEKVPVRWKSLARKLAKSKKKRGPGSEPDCIGHQQSLLADTPVLLPVERLFRERYSR